MGSPEFFLARSHLIFNPYVSAGSVRTITRTGRGDTEFTELCMPRYMCRFGISGYLRGSLVAAGQSIQVENTRRVHDGDDSCSSQCRWR